MSGVACVDRQMGLPRPVHHAFEQSVVVTHSALRFELQMVLQITRPGSAEFRPNTKKPVRVFLKTSYRHANSCHERRR